MPEKPPNIEIIINNDRKISAPAGVALLQALRQNNIFLPSACGGHGICGLCRVQVLEGAANPVTPAEEAHLNPVEQQDHLRLACQVGLSPGLRLAIPEAFFNIREFKAAVVEIRDLTRKIKELKLELLEPATIAFKSGQYIQFRIPPYAGHKRIAWRAYSIASAPADNRTIELEIGHTPNGIGTTYIFEHLKKGERVVFNGPHGDFCLRDSDKDIVMVAGGSGMAPIKSMLTDMRHRNIKRKIRYFFGARAPAEVFYADLMFSLEAARPHFQFIPTVDGKQPEEKWEGETGLVTEVVERRLEENFNGEVYLCGSPAMIEACREILRRKKVPDTRIFYDKFA